MRSSTLLAVALATLGAQAESTTVVGLFTPDMYPMAVPVEGAGHGSMVASVIDVQSSVATYQVNCKEDTPKSDCYFATPATAIQGPNTGSYSMEWIAINEAQSYDITVTQTWDCSMHLSTGSASCNVGVALAGTSTGSGTAYTSTNTVTYSSAPFGDDWYSLTVTGGLEEYTKPAATETGAAVAGPAGAMITTGPILAAAAAALL